MRALAFALAMSCTILTRPATAACGGQLDLAPATRQVTYDPLAVTGTVDTLSVRVSNTGADPCTYRVGFYRSPDTDPRLGGTLAYDLTRPGSGQSLLDDWPAGQPPTVYIETGPVAPGEQVVVEFDWRIAAGQIVPPGTYADTVRLRLYEAGTANLLDAGDLTLEATVGSAVQATLAGADVTSPYNYSMDFGTLETGEVKSVFVDVTANTGYRVTIESANAGVLRGPEKHAGGYWEVPYTATLDGTTLDLTGGSQDLDFPAPPGGLRQHEFAVTVGDVSGRRAGTYSDLVTITVAPLP